MIEILKWLFIFIIGSLIVSFIINPSSFDDVKENINGFFNSINLESKIKNQEVATINSGQFCLGSEFNRVICKGMCGAEGLNYKTFKCVNGEAICYCK